MLLESLIILVTISIILTHSNTFSQTYLPSIIQVKEKIDDYNQTLNDKLQDCSRSCLINMLLQPSN